jgi:hypothetical protein
MLASYRKSLYAAFMAVFYLVIGLHAYAQSNSASLGGTVLDPSGAVVANATVEIHKPVSHFDRSTITDSAGGTLSHSPATPSMPAHSWFP